MSLSNPKKKYKDAQFHGSTGNHGNHIIKSTICYLQRWKCFQKSKCNSLLTLDFILVRLLSLKLVLYKCT